MSVHIHIYTLYDLRSVYDHYVGSMAVIVVLLVIVALIVGYVLFICIGFLYGRVSRDQVCTHIHVHYIILPDVFLAFQEVFVAVLQKPFCYFTQQNGYHLYYIMLDHLPC